MGTNLLVTVVFWLAVTSRYGGDYDDIAYTPNAFEDWLFPTSLFLTIFMSGGIVALGVQGWRRFGVGLICGVLLVALMGLMWTFVYLVSLGS